MQGIYREEDETCNVTCAPPSSWSGMNIVITFQVAQQK